MKDGYHTNSHHKMLNDAEDLAADLSDQFGSNARMVAAYLLKILSRHTRLPPEFYDSVLNALPRCDDNASRGERSEILVRSEIDRMIAAPLTARFINSVVKSAARAMNDYGGR